VFGRLASRACLLAILLLSFCVTCWAYDIVKDFDKPDELCQKLFDTYIVPNGKIFFDDKGAASDIIASCGRTMGFWKPVLQEMRKGNVWNEGACVRILGLMLARDASAKRYIAAGAMTATFQHVCLPSDVVPELIARAKEGKSHASLDVYLTALDRARDERCKELFSGVLRNDSSNDSEKFHAAVGLVNLGDTAGVEWLIANCEGHGNVYQAWPSRTQDIDMSCLLALRSLAIRNDIRTKSDYDGWWKGSPKLETDKGWPAIDLRD